MVMVHRNKKAADSMGCSGFPGRSYQAQAAAATLLTRAGSFSLMRADLPLRERR